MFLLYGVSNFMIFLLYKINNVFSLSIKNIQHYLTEKYLVCNIHMIVEYSDKYGIEMLYRLYKNQDENVHRYAVRGKKIDRQRERERERKGTFPLGAILDNFYCRMERGQIESKRGKGERERERCMKRLNEKLHYITQFIMAQK